VANKKDDHLSELGAQDGPYALGARVSEGSNSCNLLRTREH